MKAVIIRANVGRFAYRDAEGRRRMFLPQGNALVPDNYDENPSSVRTEADKQPVWAARFMIGFNVKGKKGPQFGLEKVREVWLALRRQQVSGPKGDEPVDPSMSLIATLGTWQTFDRADPQADERGIVIEPGCQLICIRTKWFNETPEEFAANMEQIGKAMTVELQQQEIPIEVQKNGIVQFTISAYLQDVPPS